MVDLDGHHNEGNQGEQEEEDLGDLETDLTVDELGKAEFLLLAATIGDDRSSLLGLVVDKVRAADVLLDVAAVGVDRGRHC